MLSRRLIVGLPAAIAGVLVIAAACGGGGNGAAPATPQESTGEAPAPGAAAATVKFGINVETPSFPVVGVPGRISLVVLHGNGDPIRHFDMEWQLRFGDQVLAASSFNLHGNPHSHDGFLAVDYTFPKEGDYTLFVRAFPIRGVSSLQFEPLTDEFTFTVEQPPQPATANVQLEASKTTAAVGEPVDFTYAVVNAADGEPLVHGNVLFVITRDGQVLAEFPEHSHSERGGISYVFSEPGSYTVTLRSFPTPGDSPVLWTPTSASVAVQVQ